MTRDLIVVGGGPAGLAAAIAAYDSGVKKVTVVERDARLGGVLNQCIHSGFGLSRFKESLTGPEYAWRYIVEVEKRGIEVLTETTVLEITEDRRLTLMNSRLGVVEEQAGAIILATGCRERSRGAVGVAGTRPAGVFSAGTAQRYVNLTGYMPGKEVVVLGSGDIGLIMARRMALEGATVKAVCEIMPYSSGLRRNIEQCLNDFDIPLYLRTTVVGIKGKARVEGVVIASVDENRRPIAGTEREIACDTVLFSVGLIPENELAKGTGLSLQPETKGVSVDQYRHSEAEGIFVCGNALQVHDLVDYVSEEAEIAGKAAAEYLAGKRRGGKEIRVRAGEGISYALPQRLRLEDAEDVKLFFRVNGVRKGVRVVISAGGKTLLSQKKIAVAPGEMEKVILRAVLLREVAEDIEVRLENG